MVSLNYEKIKQTVAAVLGVVISITLMPAIIDCIDPAGNVTSTSSNYKSGSKYEDEENPKLILQKRYARGEINSIEYLERMTRL